MNKRLLQTMTIISFCFGAKLATAADIIACAKNNSGELRIVASAGDCKASEKALSWNAEGQQGAPGPAGPQGDAGPAGSGGSGSGQAEFRYVGVSEEEVRPSTGLLPINNACHATFPGSRMCTSAEIVNTVNPPNVASKLTIPYVYVRPVIVGVTSKDELLDASGYLSQPSENLSCGGWNFSGSGKHQALVLDYASIRHGGFRSLGCSSALQVACCAAP